MIKAIDWDVVVFCLFIIVEVLIIIFSAVQDGMAANKLCLDTAIRNEIEV